MTLAQNSVNEMIVSYKRAKEEYEKLLQELSNNDGEIQDLIHFIEFEEFDASVAFSTALKLKYLRVARRKIKNELAQLQTFIDMLDNQQLNKIQQRINIQINKQENRQYKPHKISHRPIKTINS